MAGFSASEESLVDVLVKLRASGYTEDFSISGHALRCGRCRETHEPRDAQITETFRFEGASDPDDEAIVFALVCARCGAYGTLVAAFGPILSGDEASVVASLTDARSG